jgi:hypothetical protein
VEEQKIGVTNCWEIRFTIKDPEIGVRKIASNKIKNMWPKWTITKKYKEKWERLLKKSDDEVAMK